MIIRLLLAALLLPAAAQAPASFDFADTTWFVPQVKGKLSVHLPGIGHGKATLGGDSTISLAADGTWSGMDDADQPFASGSWAPIQGTPKKLDVQVEGDGLSTLNDWVRSAVVDMLTSAGVPPSFITLDGPANETLGFRVSVSKAQGTVKARLSAKWKFVAHVVVQGHHSTGTVVLRATGPSDAQPLDVLLD